MSSTPISHELPLPKPQIIKEDDKFFSKLISKEKSMVNASTRIYYGGASSSIPFNWETTPGTPKHRLFDNDTTTLPPLTPPPSYYTNSKSCNYMGKKNNNNNNKPKLLVRNIFLKRIRSEINKFNMEVYVDDAGEDFSRDEHKCNTRGCYSLLNMKSKLLSIVGGCHGSGGVLRYW
ncbi:hypothetical protein ACFE04_030627 [Oxalis oulophora]